MSAKKKSVVLPLLFILVLPIFVLGGGALSVYIAYMRQKAGIIEEIEKLPAFDVEKESVAIAKHLGINYPVKIPEKSVEETAKMVQDALDELLEKDYSTEIFSKKVAALIKKFSVAKEGDTIKFYLKFQRDQTAPERVEGVYGGIEDRGVTGKFVTVDRTKQYPLVRIDPDYLYLFLPHISDARQRDEVDRYKKEFNEAKDACVELNKDKLEKKHFLKEGYCKDENGKWTPPMEMLKRELDKKRKAYKNSRLQKISDIIENNKLFGLFSIKIPESVYSEQ